MKDMNELATDLGSLPIEYLVIFVALAGIALAAFAIHAVYSIVKDREPRK